MDGENRTSNDLLASVTGHALAAVKEMLKSQGKDPFSNTLIVGQEDELFRVTVQENEIGRFNVTDVQRHGIQ